MSKNPNNEYWKDYNSFQEAKHTIIRKYLNGWFPKLIFGGIENIVYVDTHAGRGVHKTGEKGSPIIALETFNNHSQRDKMIEKCKINFLFFEDNEDNFNSLKNEIQMLDLPKKINIFVEKDNCFNFIEKRLSEIEKMNDRLTPSFWFIDPFSFDIPYDLLKRILNNPSVELFVNVIWRELNMSIINEKLKNKLDNIFGSDDWEYLKKVEGNERMMEFIKYIKNKLRAKYETFLGMMDKGKARYFLLHLSNHKEGKWYMKEALWKICPSGEFYIYKYMNPNQNLLFPKEPDYDKLKKEIVELLEEKSKLKCDELTEHFINTIWLKTHINECIRDLRNNGVINASGYKGKFALNKNPFLSLKEKNGD